MNSARGQFALPAGATGPPTSSSLKYTYKKIKFVYIPSTARASAKEFRTTPGAPASSIRKRMKLGLDNRWLLPLPHHMYLPSVGCSKAAAGRWGCARARARLLALLELELLQQLGARGGGTVARQLRCTLGRTGGGAELRRGC